MKIVNASLWEYGLPLKKALPQPGESQKVRRGLLLRLDWDSGFSTWGEAAPYPGLHKESLADVRRQLETLCRELSGWTPDSPPPAALAACAPSAHFAWEMALFPLLQPNLPKSWQISVSTLVNPAATPPQEAVEQLRRDGYRSVKVKVGRLPMRDELDWLRRFLDTLPPEIKPHLDANRAWRLNEAVEFLHNLPAERIRYLEEPLKEARQLPDLRRVSPVPLALDESLFQHSPGSPVAAAADYWVIKPEVAGTLDRVKKQCKAAQNTGIQVVFSNAFLSGIGTAFVALLQYLFGDKEQPAGLGTALWFEADLPEKPLHVENGKITFEVSWPTQSIKRELLKPVGEAGQ